MVGLLLSKFCIENSSYVRSDARVYCVAEGVDICLLLARVTRDEIWDLMFDTEWEFRVFFGELIEIAYDMSISCF